MDGNNKTLFQELIKRQRKDCRECKRLSLHDFKRISKNLKTSIFDASNCSLWEGYITNKNQKLKSKYINFYFRHRKVALHRLLYENYVSEIQDNQYIKYSCECKGICCNINHMYTLDVSKKKDTETTEEKPKNTQKEKTDLVVEFD